jgi:hypothetical protein
LADAVSIEATFTDAALADAVTADAVATDAVVTDAVEVSLTPGVSLTTPSVRRRPTAFLRRPRTGVARRG